MLGLVLSVTLAVAAAATDQLNQLETARLPQQVQRVEFGIEGPNSAFKFSFIDEARSCSACRASAMPLQVQFAIRSSSS
jgi:hypothetical protein